MMGTLFTQQCVGRQSDMNTSSELCDKHLRQEVLLLALHAHGNGC